MDKINELTKMQKDEEKLLLAKVNDKLKFCIARNRPENTDFLDLSEQASVSSLLEKKRAENAILFGGYEDAERKILFVLPEEIEFSNKIYAQVLKAFRITLPKDQWGTYEHKTYLGALMKLGMKREKVGDILVRNDGADIIIMAEVEKFLMQNINGLTRFQKAKIEIKSMDELIYIPPKKEVLKINVPSMRLDCLVGELARCSRNAAVDLISQERVFVDFKEELVGRKQIKEGSFITIRGKGGRFKINKILGTSKSGRINIEVEH